MLPYLNLGFFQIPSYGTIIVLGVLVANLLAFFYSRKKENDFNDFILIEGYALLGAIVGSKLLYLIVAFNEIDWSKFFEAEYFNALMQSGFVFYGGLIGGILAALLSGKIHKIDVVDFMRDYIFLIPLAHCFGRIGCFMAGCCYGTPYDGPLAVMFPENSFAPSGVNLFPVQLLEAALLLIISVIIFLLREKKHFKHTIALYVILYSVIRFALEFLRYDAARGTIGFMSTSQFISIILIIASIAYILWDTLNTDKKSA